MDPQIARVPDFFGSTPSGPDPDQYPTSVVGDVPVERLSDEVLDGLIAGLPETRQELRALTRRELGRAFRLGVYEGNVFVAAKMSTGQSFETVIATAYAWADQAGLTRIHDVTVTTEDGTMNVRLPQ